MALYIFSYHRISWLIGNRWKYSPNLLRYKKIAKCGSKSSLESVFESYKKVSQRL